MSKHRYIVLKPISPAHGPQIDPAPEPTDDNPNPEPVIVGVEIFEPPNEFSVEQRAAILIAMGVITPYVPPTKAALKESEDHGTDDSPRDSA